MRIAFLKDFMANFKFEVIFLKLLECSDMNKHIYINRDSVCMGDDMESHEVKMEINESTKLCELILKIIEMRYLASIGGGKATWVLKYNNELLAIIAQEWREPKYLVNKEKKIYNLIGVCNKPEIYFEYILQENPDMVFEKLSNAINKGMEIKGKYDVL
jgi:hypothetical protein